ERIRALFADASADGELRGDLDAGRAALTFLSLGNWAYEWLTPEHDVAREADALAPLMLERRGDVLELTLHRPEALNAFTVEMHQAMAEALREAADPAIRAVIVT